MSIDQYTNRYTLPLNTNGHSNQIYYMNKLGFIYAIRKWIGIAFLGIGIAILFNIAVQTVQTSMAKGFSDGWNLIVLIVLIFVKIIWALFFSPLALIWWGSAIPFFIAAHKFQPDYSDQLVLFRFNPKRVPFIEVHVFPVYYIYGRMTIGI